MEPWGSYRESPEDPLLLLYLLGALLFLFTLQGAYVVHEFMCPPAPVCINCQEGMSLNQIITDPDNAPSCPVG